MSLIVIAQLRGNKDSKGFKATRIASKADKPCRLPVLTIDRTAACQIPPPVRAETISDFPKNHTPSVAGHLQRTQCLFTTVISCPDGNPHAITPRLAWDDNRVRRECDSFALNQVIGRQAASIG
jgi:hypothetical protein